MKQLPSLPKNMQELYTLLRSYLEDREKCEVLRKKWTTLKSFLPKVKDVDDRLVRRNKMFTPGTGQNRCNAVERVSKEAEKNGKMDHDFLALAPRTVTKYLSFENQGRDSCKQTILPSELLFKFCESRNKFISWDAKHIRWVCMSDTEQVRQVRMTCVLN